ncbi:MAG TPA: hypothetical protein VMX13_04295 [Sedimentisphaerales bacterium]|nr:hypothetical protein [Sedimentisphaerales bacterium]
MNDNEEQACSQENAPDPEPCCAGGSCCPSGSDGGARNWKIVVFILVVIAAGVVLARSIMNKSDSISDEAQQTFAAIQPESAAPANPGVTPQTPAESGIAVEASSVTKDTTKEEAPDKPGPTLLFQPLDSLASLNEVAANFDAVFVLLGGEDQLNMQPVTKEVEAAAKTIQAGGLRVSAFTLKKESANYAQLAKQFSIPCVLAMVKGRGASGVSGEITETRLIQAYVTASRAGSSCCPGGGGACTPRPGPIRSK